MSQPDSLNVNPFRVLKEAIKQVPALKYALGVAGIAAAAAIVKSLVSDLRVAVFGIILMVVLMTVLVVFAKLTAIASKDFKLPALVLLWFSLLLVIAVSSLLFTSTFFNWPMKLKDSVVNPPLVPEQHSANTNTATNTYLRGVVRDLVTKQGVPNAVIELELLPGKTFTTASDGGFSIAEIPAAIGDNARVYVRKDGYGSRDEYVALPGPKTFYLEKMK
jgi:hypothetical protein